MGIDLRDVDQPIGTLSGGERQCVALVRWLFGEEIVGASILKPRPSRRGGPGVQDPLIVVLEMASGILVDVEVFVNGSYGYDIRGEIVGEDGTRHSPPPRPGT